MKNTKKFSEFTLKEKLTMSPIEKYEIYNKIPWKFIMSMALILLTTLQVVLLIGPESSHSREQLRVFRNLLLGYTDDQTNSTISLYTVSDVQWHFQTLFKTYLTLNDSVFQDIDIADAELYLTTYSAGKSMNNYYQSNYDIYNRTRLYLNGSIPTYFSVPANISQFFKGVTYFNLTLYSLISIVNQSLTSNSSNLIFCNNWTITTAYDIQSFSAIEVTMSGQNEFCGYKSNDIDISQYEPNFFMLHFVILICAWISLCLTAKYLFKVTTIYKEAKLIYKILKNKRIKTKNSLFKLKEAFIEQRDALVENSITNANDMNKIFEDQVDWQDLPISEKLKFFDLWFLCRIIANVFQILGASCCLIDLTSFSSNLNIIYNYRTFIGFGCFFAWLQLLGYLEHSPGIIPITTILRKAITNIFVLYVLVIPGGLAFGILGMSYFWKYNEFSRFGWSLTTIFSLSCGDVVHQTFLDVLNEGYFKQIFLFIVIICFYTGFQNIFIAIVMEGYEMSQLRKKLDNNDPFPDIKKINTQALKPFGGESSHSMNFQSESEASSVIFRNNGLILPSFNLDKPNDKGIESMSEIQDQSILSIENLNTINEAPSKPLIIHTNQPSKFQRKLFKSKTSIIPGTSESSASKSVIFTPNYIKEELNDEDEEEKQIDDNHKFKKKKCLTELFDLTSKIREELINLREIGRNSILDLSEDDRLYIKKYFNKSLFEIGRRIEFLAKTKLSFNN